MKYELFFFKEGNRYLNLDELFSFFDYCPYITVDTSKDDTPMYRVNDQRTVIVDGGFFKITNDDGDEIDKISISDFARSPRTEFRKIKQAVELEPVPN